MEKIATDTFSFEDLRRGEFVYVDKTAILKQLADGSIALPVGNESGAPGGRALPSVGADVLGGPHSLDAEMRNLSDRQIEVA